MEPLRACSAWYLWPLGVERLRAGYAGHATVWHRVWAYGVPVAEPSSVQPRSSARARHATGSSADTVNGGPALAVDQRLGVARLVVPHDAALAAA